MRKSVSLRSKLGLKDEVKKKLKCYKTKVIMNGRVIRFEGTKLEKGTYSSSKNVRKISLAK